MKNHQLLRCIFPDVLADYFDVVDIQESVTQFDFWLDERNFMEKSDHKLGTVSSYGFTSERVIQDFPLRGKAVYLHVRRRKWRDSSNGEIFTYSYDDLTAEGSKLSPEFVSFLNSAVFFLVRKFYMLRCLLGALYFDMRRFGVFWVFSKHKIPHPNQWGSMKNHKK